MNRLLHMPAISSVACVPNSTSQAKSEMRQVMEMAPVYPDLRRPSAPGQITEMSEYYSSAMTPVNGYHHASVEHTSMEMGYPKQQSQAPISRILEPSHSFTEHDLHIRKTRSSGSISPEYVSPEGPDEVSFERSYKNYSQNQDSICSSSCSSPEFERQARQASLYLRNESEVVKEEFDSYSLVEEAPDHPDYHGLPSDHVDKSYQAFHYTQGTPEARPPHIDRDIVPSEVTPKGGGKKAPSAKVSEKRREQNRAAQRAMRERRKRAAQHQEVHMAAILSENAHLRERVGYLSNLLLTHTTVHPEHIQEWGPYARKPPQPLTPISTVNLSNPSSVADYSPQEASGALPSIYSSHEPVHYSHSTNSDQFMNPYPPATYQMDHSSSNARNMPGASSSSGFLCPKISGVGVIEGKTHEHPEWDSYTMGDVDHSERHLGMVRTMDCISVATSTVPSPTETDGHSIDIVPRAGH